MVASTLSRVSRSTAKTASCVACRSKKLRNASVTLREGGNAPLRRCQTCGHGTLDGLPGVSPTYYETEYRKAHSANLGESTSQEEHLSIYEDLNRRQFQQLKKVLFRRTTRYLEIGCSFGGLIRYVEPIVKECHAVEANPDDARFVKDTFGVEVIPTSFEEASLPENYYDVVCALEVLEHVPDVRGFLRKAHRLLRRRGVLHLEVPNHRDALLSAYENPAYRSFFYHQAHRHYFTAASLLRCTQAAGFQGRVSSFQMYPFFNHVNWHFHQAPQRHGKDALLVPTPCRTDEEVGKRINRFYREVADTYDKLVTRLGVGDCLVYHGRKG